MTSALVLAPGMQNCDHTATCGLLGPNINSPCHHTSSLIWNLDLYSKYTTPVKQRYSGVSALSNEGEGGRQKGTMGLLLNARDLKL